MLLDLSSYLTTFERSASPYVDVVELINNPCYFLIIFVGLYLRARIFVLKDSLDSLDIATSGSRRFREDPDGTMLLKLHPEISILLILTGLLLASRIVLDKPGEVLGIVDLLAEHTLAALAEYALALVCWHGY